MLIKLGYSCGTAGADGDFGNNTLKALKNFQKDNKLVVDGIYGPISKEKLTTSYNNSIKNSKNKNNIYAESFNNKIKGTYTTTSKLNLRKGPDTSYEVITIIPKNDKVQCYGYYTKDWYYVTYQNYTGFCNKKWLK